MLTSCDNQDWPRIVIDHWDTSQRQQLAHRDRLLRLLPSVQDTGVEAFRLEEEILLRCVILVCQIAIDVGHLLARAYAGSIICETICVHHVLDGFAGQIDTTRTKRRNEGSATNRCVTKAKRLVKICLYKASSCGEERQEGSVQGEPG